MTETRESAARRLLVYLVVLTALAFLSLPTFAQTPRPTRNLNKAEFDSLDDGQKKSCVEHFPGASQSTMRVSCYLGLALHKEKKLDGALNECGKLTPGQSRTESACKIGAIIAEETVRKNDGFRARLRVCQSHYPIRSEADTYLQESCIIGVYLAFEFKGSPVKKPKLELCEKISKDRGFVAPCGAGLSLAAEPTLPTQLSSDALNKACMKYFDPVAFHQGYRSCLNARALSLSWDGKSGISLVKECQKLTAAKHGDTEEAACIVGGNLLRHIRTTTVQDNPRFKNCGEGRVSWARRDYLLCLTAASLLDLTSTTLARNTCKDIFGGRRNSLRNDCFREVDALSTQAVALLPTPTPKPMETAKARAEEGDLWPESPDVPPEEVEADEAPATDTDQGDVPVIESTSGQLDQDSLPAILGDHMERGPVSIDSPSEVDAPNDGTLDTAPAPTGERE